MNKQIPTINKIIQFHDFKRNWNFHQSKIKNVKPTLTTRSFNQVKTHMSLNKTAKQPFGNTFSRMIDIQLQNKALLKKLTQKNVGTARHNFQQSFQNDCRYKLVKNNRKKYFEEYERRIENEGLLKRIKQTKPLYKMEKYMTQRKVTEKYINSISKFGYKDYKPNKTILKFEMNKGSDRNDWSNGDSGQGLNNCMDWNEEGKNGMNMMRNPLKSKPVKQDKKWQQIVQRKGKQNVQKIEKQRIKMKGWQKEKFREESEQCIKKSQKQKQIKLKMGSPNEYKLRILNKKEQSDSNYNDNEMKEKQQDASGSKRSKLKQKQDNGQLLRNKSIKGRRHQHHEGDRSHSQKSKLSFSNSCQKSDRNPLAIISQRQLKINGKSFQIKGKQFLNKLTLQILELKNKSIGNDYIHQVQISKQLYLKKFNGKFDVLLQNLHFDSSQQIFYFL